MALAAELSSERNEVNGREYDDVTPPPALTVGTLDVLVGLSDELAKLDSFVESVVKKVAQYMADVLEDSRDKVQENLLANGVDLVTYITRFQWDMAKYPIKQSLKNISEIIAKQLTQIDNDLKARASAYNNLKGNLQNLERKNATEKKLLDKCPLNYAAVRLMACLDPVTMISDERRAISMFEKLLQLLLNAKWHTAEDCDQILSEYKMFLTEMVQHHKEEFQGYRSSSCRLDAFMGRFAGDKAEYAILWKSMKDLFTLSHGQAAVERGYSVNKDMLVTNLKGRTDVSSPNPRFFDWWLI
ncbi:VTC1A ATPase, partial [Polypterus senegalus]